MNVKRYMDLAAQVSRLKDDDRTYFHGAVGLRKDGVLVAACNGNPKEPTPEHHCEYRLSRKLGRGGVVFLVRTLADGTWGDSTPCSDCQNRLRHMGVKRVYYSTGMYWDGENGPIHLICSWNMVEEVFYGRSGPPQAPVG